MVLNNLFDQIVYRTGSQPPLGRRIFEILNSSPVVSIPLTLALWPQATPSPQAGRGNNSSRVQAGRGALEQEEIYPLAPGIGGEGWGEGDVSIIQTQVGIYSSQ